jgi:CubicO group peptidase (beta-lactamase class C family)
MSGQSLSSRPRPRIRPTIFDAASMSRPFTTFAVQLLAQEHQLSLDDQVRKYLPELHDFGFLSGGANGVVGLWELPPALTSPLVTPRAESLARPADSRTTP